MRGELLDRWQTVVQRGFRWTASSAAILQVVSLLKAIAIGRTLGAEAVGIYALLLIASTFGYRFSDFGLSNSLIHYRELNRHQLGGLYLVNAIGGAVISVAVIVVGSLLSPKLAEFLPYIGLAIFIKSMAQQYQFLFQRDHKLSILSKVDLISVVVGEALCIVLLFSGYGLMSIVWGVLTISILYSTLYSYWGIKQYGIPYAFAPSFREFKKIFTWGMFQMGEGLLGYWGQRADRLILVSFAGLEFLGYYTLAIQLIMKPYKFLGNIISRVFQPIYSEVVGNIEATNQIYLNNTKVVASLLFPVYGLIALQAEWIIVTLYGEGWDLTDRILQALCILGAFKAIYVNIGSYLLGVGKPDYGFYLNIYNSILAIGLISIGVGYFTPMTGVVIYSFGVSFLALPADVYIRYKSTSMPVKPFLVLLVKVGSITLLCLTLSYFTTMIFKETLGYSNIIQVLLYSFLTCWLTFRYIFNSSRTELLQSTWLSK